MGNKKAKAQGNGAASSSAMDASLHMIIVEVVASTKKKKYRERDDKNDARWNAFLDSINQKSKLEEAKVEAAKVTAHATLLQAMKEAPQAAVTKMKEDSKILTADTSMMDDDAKAWYKMAQECIMQEMKAATKQSATSQQPTPPTAPLHPPSAP
jgi:hypothetical protein